VHAERDSHVLARVGVLKPHDPAGAAATHGENVGTVDLVPCATVGVAPHRLFDDAEAAPRIVCLENAGGDGVGGHAARRGSGCQRVVNSEMSGEQTFGVYDR